MGTHRSESRGTAPFAPSANIRFAWKGAHFCDCRHVTDLRLNFRSIRGAARSNRMKLHDLVRKIRPGESTPEELGSLVREDQPSRADV